MRIGILALALVMTAAPLAGQDRPADPPAAARPATLPPGWTVRLDRADAPLAEVRFARMGEGYHVTLGPSAIFYNPEHVAEGEYTARARFTQTRPSRHPEGYGLLIGGRNLDGPAQEYLYFLVRQDGRFLIKHRAGAETHTLQDWTEQAAVRALDEGGRATNELAIEAGPQSARFLVNGVEVANLRNAPHLETAGIVGLRINHNLDLHVDGFSIERRSR